MSFAIRGCYSARWNLVFAPVLLKPSLHLDVIYSMRNTSDLLAVQCSWNHVYLASEERQNLNLHQDYALRN